MGRIALQDLPWWQVTSLLNALLTFVLLYFASSALPRIEAKPPTWPPTRVESTVKGITFTRGVLSLYSIAAVLYIFIAGPWFPNWPPLGTKFLPFW